ncbi:MAG: TlpA disulfide reductase family protein, partial [Bacteroidota bacterium]
NFLMEKTSGEIRQAIISYLPAVLTSLIILIGLYFLQDLSFAWRFTFLGLVALVGGLINRELHEVNPSYVGAVMGAITFVGLRFLIEQDFFLPLFAFIMGSAGAEYKEGLAQWKEREFLKKIVIPALLTPTAAFVLIPFAFSMFLNSSDNTPAPDLTFVTMDGETILPAETKGKVVVLDFWGTWCGPCLQAFPDMEILYNQYKDNEDVEFWFLNTLSGDTPESVQAFLEKKPYDLPLGFDIYGLQEKMDINSIPNTLIIDKQGNIRFRHIGFFAGENLPASLGGKIDMLLAEE